MWLCGVSLIMQWLKGENIIAVVGGGVDGTASLVYMVWCGLK